MDWINEKLGPVKAAEMIEKAREKPELARVLDEAGNDYFGLWLLFVNRALRPLGVGHRDLADWTWRDGFDDGMRPAEAAREALAQDDIGQLLVGS